MGVLCYLGVLLVIPLLIAKGDPFVKYHIKQGLVLVVMWAVVWALQMFLWSFAPFYQILSFATFILSIIGIINVVQGKEKELPIVGQFGNSFKI